MANLANGVPGSDGGRRASGQGDKLPRTPAETPVRQLAHLSGGQVAAHAGRNPREATCRRLRGMNCLPPAPRRRAATCPPRPRFDRPRQRPTGARHDRGSSRSPDLIGIRPTLPAETSGARAMRPQHRCARKLSRPALDAAGRKTPRPRRSAVPGRIGPESPAQCPIRDWGISGPCDGPGIPFQSKTL